MIKSSKDPEIEKIQRKKIAEMLQQAQIQVKPAGTPNGKPIVLTDGNFRFEVTNHNLLVVDFWAPWCGPCRMVGPMIEQLAVEYAGKVAFGKMNVDENQTIPSRFGILSIPTLIIFKSGKPVETIIGACPKHDIEAKLKPFMGKDR